ncbi:MAG: S8 family serine peptidase [Saprospiraceae bacterium]
MTEASRYFLVLFCLFSGSQSFVQGQNLNFKQGELILWLNKDVSYKNFINKQLSSRSRVISKLEGSVLNSDWNIHLLKFDYSQTSEEELMASFRGQSELLMVQKNHILTSRKTPNDTYFYKQWQYLNDGTQGGIQGADTRANLAWDITTGGLTEENDSIVVCVIDGGLEFTHLDLKSNIWYNRAEIPGNGIDDDKNGYIDDFKGWNSYANNDSIISNNHGTEVCGVIGAIGNNRLGGSGVNWNVKIMMVQGGGDEASAIVSYSYPWKMRKDYNLSNGKKGAYVVSTNSSWGRDYGKPDEAPIWCAMYDSLGSVGILNAASTANLDINVDIEGDLPTNCESEYLIGVTNINWGDHKESRAGYGIKSVEMGAYGEQIFTTTTPNTFGWFNGTSAASPEIAGAIALMYSVPCNNLVRLSKTNPSQAALLARDILYQQGRKIKSLETLIKTGSVLNLQDVVYAIHPIVVIAEGNQLVFQSTTNPLTPIKLQYRLIGSNEWIEITINNTQKVVIPNLGKCETYEYRILGGCDRYKMDYSNIQYVTTKGCCVAPEKIELVEINNDQVIIQFKGISENSNFVYVLNEEGSLNRDTFSIANFNDPILSISGLKNCNKYELQLLNYCGNLFSPPSSIVVFKTTGCDQCDDMDYCKRDRPSSDLEWLESIEIDGDFFGSENNMGYGEFVGSNHTWNLIKSSSHSITLTPGYSGDSSQVYLAAWIDFNHNAVFENTENVIPLNYKSKLQSRFLFNIPPNAKTGITRMRVIAKYGENGVTAPLPCFNGVEFGEYEDYCVGIIENQCGPILSVEETSKLSSTISFKINKSNTADIIVYQYRKLPYGIWQEGRLFNNILNLTKLDSCSNYEMRMKTECDFIHSNEFIVNFNTITNSCFVKSIDIHNANLNIFPNPFDEYLTIESELEEISSIKIYDLNGKAVNFTSSQSSNGKSILRLLDVESGIYLLECKFSNGTKSIKRISKI